MFWVDNGAYGISTSFLPQRFKTLVGFENDLQQGIIDAVPIPPSDSGKEEVIVALVANVDTMIKADLKITALKQMQVRKIWLKIFLLWSLAFISDTYLCRVITGELDFREMNWKEDFDDVPEALEKVHSLGTKVFSFSFPFSFEFSCQYGSNFCVFPSISLWVLSCCYWTTSICVVQIIDKPI